MDLDALCDDFVRVLGLFIDITEVEYDLISELLFDDDDDDDNDRVAHEDILARGDRGEMLNHMTDLIEAALGHIVLDELIEMACGDEDDLLLEIFYGPNDRTIDWRAALPKMEYLRTIEDPYFLQQFRMNRATFEVLLVVIGNHLVENNLLIRLRTELDKCILMSLWILANMDTFRATGVVFGVSRGTVHCHYIVVIEALRNLAGRYIKWPSPQERLRIKEKIEQRTGYPGVVGFIDGTLIRVTAPAIQKERYFDRKQSYSLNVQAVCDHNLLFRDVHLGNPGSVHDQRVLERSPLHDMLLERRDVIGEDEHILGDGGYTCTEKLLVPYRDLGNMTIRQRRFNYVHSSIRMYIERAFGRLKGKFRRLLLLYTKRYVYTLDHIIASFVLHNFIILNGCEMNGICINQPIAPQDEGEWEEEDEDAIRDEEPEGHPRRARPDDHPLLAQSKVAGAQKREAIADRLFNDYNEL